MNMSKLYFRLAGIALVLLSPLFVLAQTDNSADNIKTDLQYLSSDELGGRLAGTRENATAAEYIIRRFKQIGLLPLAGKYSQEFQINYRMQPTANNAFTITKIVERPGLPPDMWLKAKKKWTSGKEFMPLAISANGSAAGEVAFVGYGISAPEHSYDDYQNIDVNGKIVIVISDSADGQPLDESFINYSTLAYKVQNAKKHGAVGVVFVKRLSDSANTFYPFKIASGYQNFGIPAVQVKRTEIAKYFPKKKKMYPVEMQLMQTKQPQSFILPRVTIEISTELQPEKATVSNVFAMLKGNEKPDEYILVGAHFDHIGHGEIQIKRRSRYPKIYNGADDNASGVAAMLELARRFKDNPPARSIIFVSFNAEEMGLLGSDYFVNNPPLPLEKIKTMFNFDMVGRLKDNIILFGTGTSNTLNSIVDRIAGDSIAITKNSGGYGPSDHASFIMKKIPAIFFFTGTHDDYNTENDDWNRINYRGMLRVIDFAERVVRDAASNNEFDFIAPKGHSMGAHSKGKIKVSFGSIPDFANSADGFIIKGCRGGTPCERSGMQAGDVLTLFNGKPVNNIMDFTNALKEVSPGDMVKIVYLHNGKEITKEIKLDAK